MRKTWDQYFIDIARGAAARSTCPKRHVGAVLVDSNNYIISTGYNGSAPGADHCDDVGCLEVNGRCKRTIHAEKNAIKRSNWWERRHSKLYVTDFPCYDCAELITKKGIVEVIYDKKLERSPDDVLNLFLKNGIVIRQYISG